MPEKESLRKTSNTVTYNFDESLSEILSALEQIRKNIPNGELKALQDKVTSIEENQDELNEELKEDFREIKKILLDPVTGVVVKVNKSLELSQKTEDYIEKEFKPKVEKLVQIDLWKDTVSKILWLLFAGIVSILLNILFRKD